VVFSRAPLVTSGKALGRGQPLLLSRHYRERGIAL
jgi:hypothetical protein